MICRAPAADPAAGVPAGEAAAGVGEVKQEEPAGQEQPPADAAAAGAVAAAAEQPTDAQEVKHGADSGRGGKSSAPTQGVDLGSFKLPADAVLKQEIPLPRRMASCVIGIKGQSVSKLRRESGAKIHVRPAAGREEMDQVVEVEGPIESVSVDCILQHSFTADSPRTFTAAQKAWLVTPSAHSSVRRVRAQQPFGSAGQVQEHRRLHTACSYPADLRALCRLCRL